MVLKEPGNKSVVDLVFAAFASGRAKRHFDIWSAIRVKHPPFPLMSAVVINLCAIGNVTLIEQYFTRIICICAEIGDEATLPPAG